MLTACSTLSMAERINTEVNAGMSFKEDGPGRDAWSTDCPKQGDCEDYALCKMRKLSEAGYAPIRHCAQLSGTMLISGNTGIGASSRLQRR
ncbi:MAG: Bacterial transglutaminase-like cysteine proteinase [Spartobacteria bacterium]|nr:Bacterial transglutaminase-like cysteine proteinase [Spartobacteria bacterium]